MFMPNRSVLVRTFKSALPALIFSLLGVYAFWPWISLPFQEAPPRTLIVYGFSILGEVINEGVFPKFQKEWRERTGEHVELISSFAGSGTITNQIIMGVPAHIVILSLELDALRLVKAGRTQAQSRRALPHRGVVNRSPLIILVRSGNPKQVNDFEDLAKPGVEVIHPDPFTSGGANWAIIAEYGAGVRKNPGRPMAGEELLLGIWRNVAAQASSSRSARTQFENGFGDALITYEQEAVWDKSLGRLKLDIVHPFSTVMTEHTLVVLDHNVAPEERELVDAFVSFLWSESAQQTFVEYGFRSVYDSLNDSNPYFADIDDQFLIEDFGGWPSAKRHIIDTIWKKKILKELRR